MATKVKMCSRHGKEHPVTDFPKDKKQHDRLSTWCKQAWREYRAEKTGGKAPAKKVAVKSGPGAKSTSAPAKRTIKVKNTATVKEDN